MLLLAVELSFCASMEGDTVAISFLDKTIHMYVIFFLSRSELIQSISKMVLKRWQWIFLMP